jgi:glucose/arabinose dehydrogenase
VWWPIAFPISETKLAPPRRPRQSRLSRSRRLTLELLEAKSLLATLPSGFEAQVVVDGLYEPTAMVVAPENRIFVTEKPFGVRVVQDGELLETPLLTLPVERSGERGVGGLVLDPNFATNGHLYVYYTRLAGENAVNRLSRFTISSADPNVADPASERVLLDGIATIEPGYHNGGLLQFGADGMLYVGIGDVLQTSLVQNLSRLEGKILRINPAAYPSIVPPDNPFVGTPGARGEIWALGFRNPYTGAIQPETGRIFVNDVGSGSFEEIDELARGRNYGWPLAEGTSNNTSFTNPIYAYAHEPDQGAAITGGVFYSGSAFPAEYAGRYFFGDYVRGFIRTLDPGTNQASEFATDFIAPVDFDNAPDGNLYVLSLGPGNDPNGSIVLVRHIAGKRTPIAAGVATPAAGQPPLAVSFDGSASTDPDDDELTFQWDFGDGEAATGAITNHVYNVLGTYTAKLTVNDGEASATKTFTIIVGNTPPVPTISLPAIGTMYRAGDTIAFAGSATDDDDGQLPEASLSWKVVFHHGEHTHPFLDGIPGTSSGSFQIPVAGEVAPDQWYRILLTAIDSEGLTSSTFVDVRPQVASFRLASNVPGASLLLDGQPVAAGTTTAGVVGMTRTIAAPATQVIGGRLYRFAGWSDGGAAAHDIATPASDTTLFAQYRPVGLAAAFSSNPPVVIKAGRSITYRVTVTNIGAETWYFAGRNRVELRVNFGASSDTPGALGTKPIPFGLRRVVTPGQSYTFTVKVTAPKKPGNYILRHRLVKAPAVWFDTTQQLSVVVKR